MDTNNEMKWWVVDAKVPGMNVQHLGKCHSTRKAIEDECGPYLTFTGNHVLIWGMPKKSLA